MPSLRSLVALSVLLALPAAAFAAGDSGPVEPAATPSAYEQGRAQVEEGNWAQAAALFREAVSENPSDYKAYNMLGYSLRSMGKAREALEAYGKALSLKPDYAEALEYRGVAFLKAGDLGAAKEDLARLERLRSPLATELREALAKAGRRP